MMAGPGRAGQGKAAGAHAGQKNFVDLATMAARIFTAAQLERFEVALGSYPLGVVKGLCKL